MTDSLKVDKVESKGYGIIYKLPMQDKDLDVVAKAFYAYICSYAGAGDTAFPGMDKICSDLGVSRQRLERHRKALVDKGYITINKIKENGRFARNEYKINKSIPTLQNATTENATMEITTTENVTINNNSINNNNTNINTLVTSSEATVKKNNKSDLIHEQAMNVFNFYVSLTGSRISPTPANLAEVKGRLKEGEVTESDCYEVIKFKFAECTKNKNFKYFTLVSMFRKKNVPNTIQQIDLMKTKKFQFTDDYSNKKQQSYKQNENISFGGMLDEYERGSQPVRQNQYTLPEPFEYED